MKKQKKGNPTVAERMGFVGMLKLPAAARALGISPETLRLWAEKDKVPYKRTLGGHRFFDVEELRKIFK